MILRVPKKMQGGKTPQSQKGLCKIKTDYVLVKDASKRSLLFLPAQAPETRKQL